MEAFFVTIQYRLNRFEFSIPSKGIKVSELIELACHKFGLNASRHYLSEKGIRLNDSSVVMVWSTVDLMSFDDVVQQGTPSMQALLWETYSHHWGQPREALFELASQDLFLEIRNHLIKLAKYRQFSATIHFALMNQGFTPPSWVSYVKPVMYELEEQRAVLSLLEIRCHREKLFPNVTDDKMTWIFNWKGDQVDQVVPKLTARDLVEMGYNIGEQRKFGQILVQLRRAILCSQVSDDSPEAQRQWVRKKFPN